MRSALLGPCVQIAWTSGTGLHRFRPSALRALLLTRARSWTGGLDAVFRGSERRKIDFSRTHQLCICGFVYSRIDLRRQATSCRATTGLELAAEKIAALYAPPIAPN